MWVILGPFDGEVTGDVTFQKPKLLKPNTTYTVGRKDKPLLINNKKISAAHCDFIVGNHNTDDAGDASTRPSLEIFNLNKKDKILRIDRRDETEHSAPTNSKARLEDGDRISLISGIVVQVEWRPVCVYYPSFRGSVSISIDTCASLGIKLVRTVQENMTHHLATHYVANLSMATSLLTLCRIVKPEWLVEVLRLGSLPRNNENLDGISLEDHFVLPQETKFRPAFSPSLMPSQKAFDIWEPNEERVNFFGPLRFICLHEKITQLDSELRDAIHRGGGNLETFDIHSGVSKFRKALTRSQAKEGKQTIVVGDADAMQTAIGTEGWAQLVSETQSFGLCILSPSKVVQSVLDVNLVLLQSSAMEIDGGNAVPAQSPLPDVVPNSFPDEPSALPALTTMPRKRLVRRTASRSGSQEPSATPAIAEIPAQSEEPREPSSRPRRNLTRRVVGGQPVVTGLDDPSSILDETPDLRKTPPPTAIRSSLMVPTPGRPSRLKRRVGVPGHDVVLAGDSYTSGMDETIAEPPLKKFKALFEASNPGGVPSEAEPDSLDLVEGSRHSESQTQTQTQSRSGYPSRKILGASDLAVLREEEEEENTPSGPLGITEQRGTKRRMENVNEDEEMEIDGILAPSNGSLPPAKRRLVQGVNVVERTGAAVASGTFNNAASKPPSTIAPAKGKETGAPAGKPDTDAAFLKAIASKKRGKKTEDAFDREFNNLKISKPEIGQQDPEDEYDVLADFGDDSGLRGNFMVIVEMDLYHKNGSEQRRGALNHSWDGKPNFKKFKQKITGVPRTTIELVISDQNDYGMGSAYWKEGQSQHPASQKHNTFLDESQVEIDSQMEIKTTSQPAESKRSRSKPLLEPDYDDDDEPVIVAPKSRKPPARSQTRAKPPAKSTTKGKAAVRKAPLFLDSDDDIQDINIEDSHEPDNRVYADDDETLRSTAETRGSVGRRPTRTSKTIAKKAPPVTLDDDSDDGAFKGFRGR